MKQQQFPSQSFQIFKFHFSFPTLISRTPNFQILKYAKLDNVILIQTSSLIPCNYLSTPPYPIPLFIILPQLQTLKFLYVVDIENFKDYDD
jgi:hypothetical protein